MKFIKTPFKKQEVINMPSKISDFIKNRDILIVSTDISIWINKEEICFYDNISSITLKNSLLYIVFTNSKICIFNIIDFSLMFLYDGIDEQVISVTYSSSFMYIQCSNNKLYRSSYATIEYTCIAQDVYIYCILDNDTLIYCDIYGRLIYNNEFIKELLFDVIGIIPNDTDIHIETDLDIQNDLFIKLQILTYNIGELYFYTIHGPDKTKIRDCGQIFAIGNYIFNIKNQEVYKNKRTDIVKTYDNRIYFVQGSFINELVVDRF